MELKVGGIESWWYLELVISGADEINLNTCIYICLHVYLYKSCVLSGPSA